MFDVWDFIVFLLRMVYDGVFIDGFFILIEYIQSSRSFIQTTNNINSQLVESGSFVDQRQSTDIHENH
jgi:hypothetical protein